MTTPPASILERFEAAVNEAVSMCMEGGAHTSELADVLQKIARELRQPYQNPEDNQAERAAAPRQ